MNPIRTSAERWIIQGMMVASLSMLALAADAGRITDISDHARVENRFYSGERGRHHDRPHRRYRSHQPRRHKHGHHRREHSHRDHWRGRHRYRHFYYYLDCWPYICTPTRRWDRFSDWDDDGYLDFIFHYRLYDD
ncbi:MAG TPA: hypothetical protein EYH03_00325 [Chromatiales bacterium]|nr:hypothetical protein [Chromatiales bacterium]